MAKVQADLCKSKAQLVINDNSSELVHVLPNRPRVTKEKHLVITERFIVLPQLSSLALACLTLDR